MTSVQAGNLEDVTPGGIPPEMKPPQTYHMAIMLKKQDDSSSTKAVEKRAQQVSHAA